MSKKYVVSIMNRVFLGDGNFVFYESHPEIGEIDPNTHIFTDRNGSEYALMTDPCLLMSEVSTAYGNAIEMNSLPNLMEAPSMKEAIRDFGFYCSRYIYYVAHEESGHVFNVPIDIAQMRANLNSVVSSVEKNGGFEKISEEGARIPYDRENTSHDENMDKSSLGDSFVFLRDIRSDIDAFFLELMEGAYSLDDLKKIRKNVACQQEDMESLLDSLDLQIEASEKGESSITLKNEGTKKEVEKEKIASFFETEVLAKMPNYIDINSICQKVVRTLIAQDEAVRRVVSEIARKEQCPSAKNRGILVTGPTGCGKTKMMQLIAKYLDRPFFKIDATQLTIPGYVGLDIEEALWDLYIQCGRDKEKVEHAIIFFDEIDKKGSSKKEDISGRGVLNLLLQFIEGTTYSACESVKKQNEVVKIDTSNMIVIFGGAFTDVYKHLNQNNDIGFGGDVTKSSKKREATTLDFVDKAKIPDEFMGRVSVVHLNELELEDIKRILLESDESAIHVQEKIFHDLGVKITFTDGYVTEVARCAEKRKTGARGLHTVVDESTWEAYADAYSHMGEYSEIIMDERCIQDPKSYQKVLRKR